MGSQEKYLLSFKNTFENSYMEEKMFPFREIKDLWVGGASLPLPFSTLKFALPLKDSNICKY